MRNASVVAVLLSGLVSSLVACSGGEHATEGPPAGQPAPAHTGKPLPPTTNDKTPTKANPPAEKRVLEAPTFLAHYAKAKGGQPEGIFVVRAENSATEPTIYMSFATGGEIVTFEKDGTTKAFGKISNAPVKNSFVFGLVPDAEGNLYAAVAAGGPDPVPAPGVYKFT